MGACDRGSEVSGTQGPAAPAALGTGGWNHMTGVSGKRPRPGTGQHSAGAGRLAAGANEAVLPRPPGPAVGADTVEVARRNPARVETMTPRQRRAGEPRGSGMVEPVRLRANDAPACRPRRRRLYAN